MSDGLDYRYEHVFRSQGAVAFAAICSAVATLLFAGTLLEGGSAAWDAAAGAVAVVGGFVTVRVARAGIVTRPEVIWVRGVFSTRRVQWSDVDDATIAPPAFTLNPNVVRIGLRLRDGRVLSTSALSASSSSARSAETTMTAAAPSFSMQQS